MIIINKNKKELSSLEQWEAGFKEVDEPKHWEPGYSAHSLGVFFTSGKGEIWVNEIAEMMLGDKVTWNEAVIEHESKLDEFAGKHRMQDLALWGTTSKNEKVFMGIEAKVLESFGNYALRDEYDEALKYQATKNPNSNKPERVKQITEYLFPGQNPYDKAICDLRYQLMHYFQASLKEAANYSESKRPILKRKSRVDIVLLPVLVFMTNHYYENPEKADRNKEDYIAFCKALGLNQKVRAGKEFWEGIIDGRRVYTLYEKVSLD